MTGSAAKKNQQQVSVSTPALRIVEHGESRRPTVVIPNELLELHRWIDENGVRLFRLDDGFAVIQLKNCFDASRELLPWAAEAVREFDSLTIAGRRAKSAIILVRGSWSGLPKVAGENVVVHRQGVVNFANKEVIHQSPVRDGGDSLIAMIRRTSEVLDSWIAAFDLARELKAEGGDDPESLAPQVREWCLANGRNFADFFEDFLESYGKVKVASGEELLAPALALAESDPYPCDDHVAEYQRAVSIAFHLSRGNDERTFFFAPAVAEALGVEPRTTNRYLARMVAAGLAECVDDKYQPGRKAKIYKFLGNEPKPTPPSPLQSTAESVEEPEVVPTGRITAPQGTRDRIEAKLAKANAGRTERTLTYEDLRSAVRSSDNLDKPQFVHGGIGDDGETTVAVAVKSGDKIYLGIGTAPANAPRASHIHSALNTIVPRKVRNDPGLSRLVNERRDPETIRLKLAEWIAAGDVIEFEVNPQAPRFA